MLRRANINAAFQNGSNVMNLAFALDNFTIALVSMPFEYMITVPGGES
jgi:hypothetical protein